MRSAPTFAESTTWKNLYLNVLERSHVTQEVLLRQ